MDILTGPKYPTGAFPATRPLATPPIVPTPSPDGSSSIDPEVARLSLDRQRQAAELGWLASMAYQPVKTLPGLLAPHGFREVEPLSRWLTGTQAVFAIKDRRAVIAFRGSESTLDWIVDFLFLPVWLPPRHLGFMIAWCSARGRATRFLERHRGDFDAIELCGHSLGGAVAKVAAFDLASTYPIEAVVTLGAPRAFWGWGARAYNRKTTADRRRLGELTRSFVNGSDIVARIPPWFVGYVHTQGTEASEPRDNDPWFVRLLDRIATERAATPLMPNWPLSPTATVRHAPDTAGDDVVGLIARGYVWGDKYFQWLTHLAVVVVAPVALYALYVWLLGAVIRAALAHPNAGYHREFFRGSLAVRVLPIPVRSRAARLAGLGLMLPLLIVGVGLLWPLLLFSLRFALWVPQTMYSLLQMNS